MTGHGVKGAKGSVRATVDAETNLEGFRSRNARWLFAPDGERLGVVLPDGPVVGLYGLSGAVARLHEAMAGVGRGRGGVPITAALGEALFWVGALDDHFQHDDPRWPTRDDYFSRRNDDDAGRTVGGLIYVRHLQVHGLHTAALGRPATTGFGLGHVWAAWISLPRPRTPEGKGRRHLLYEAYVEGRPLTAPLDVAQEWFQALAAGGQ